MTSKEALKCIIYRLTAQEDDLELRETAKVEIEIIKKDLDRLEKLEQENLKLKRFETDYHMSLAFLKAQKEEIQDLRQQLNVKEEKCVLLKTLNKLKEVNDILKYCVTESLGLDGYYQAGFLTTEEYELLKETLNANE